MIRACNGKLVLSRRSYRQPARIKFLKPVCGERYLVVQIFREEGICLPKVIRYAMTTVIAGTCHCSTVLNHSILIVKSHSNQLRFEILGRAVLKFLRAVWYENDGQDIAEYGIMLVVLMIIVIGTVRLIGANTSNVFSSVSSTIR
jgi:Flp pilus assembly pilin Flp